MAMDAGASGAVDPDAGAGALSAYLPRMTLPSRVGSPGAHAEAPMERGVVLLDAHNVPQRSGSNRGALCLSLLMCGVAGSAATAFALLGAWPVMGFVGLELPIVAVLLLAHRRRSARTWERVVLADGVLRVSRDDGRGRRSEKVLEPYWTRVREEHRPGRARALRLLCRGRSVEIGLFLADRERAELADSLRDALRHHREPRFDNPQLQP